MTEKKLINFTYKPVTGNDFVEYVNNTRTQITSQKLFHSRKDRTRLPFNLYPTFQTEHSTEVTRRDISSSPPSFPDIITHYAVYEKTLYTYS